MRRIYGLGALCGTLIALTTTSGALAQSAADLALAQVLDGAAKAREEKNASAYLGHARDLLRLAPQFPRSRLAVARGLAWTGDAKGAAAELERIAAEGFAYELDAEFAGVRTDPAIVAAEAKLAANRGRTVGQALGTEAVGRPGLWPEGIAWSPSERVYYIGSIPSGEVFRGTPGAFTPVYRMPEAGWQPLGMKVDREGRNLWVCYTRASGGPRVSRLVQLALPAMKPAGMTDLPGDNPTCNDLDVAPDGRVLVTDFSQHRLLVWNKGSFTPVDGIRSANGVAVDDVGRYAYVAYFNGIRRVDLRDLSILDVVPANAPIGGMDGLYWRAGSLYGVQGTASPARVIRIRLSAPSSTRATVDTLLGGHADLTEPTTAAWRDDRLVVLSRTGIFSQNKEADPLLVQLAP